MKTRREVCLRIPKKMADEALSRAGLHFDELNKIRVLEPEVQQQTSELKEECKDFVDSKISRLTVVDTQ